MIEFNKQQDIISIIAPASACKDESGKRDLTASYANLNLILSLFKQEGFNCQYDNQIFSGQTLEYFSATKSERLRQLKQAIEDPKVKIISTLRGGYGCSEIVFDCLPIKPSTPKILIGFSDITALHFLFNQHYNLPSIHGLVNQTYQHMLPNIISLLSGNTNSFQLFPVNYQSNHLQNTISGIVTGGNLSIICNMIGTKLHPDTKNKILIIEDVNEAGYKIHRNLLHMYNAGLFKNAEAVIFADFIKSDQFLDTSISHFIDNYLHSIPTFTVSNIGHGNINYPFILGARGVISNTELVIDNHLKLV
ncbi:MAG: LD-carboxypeptidase [Rickettsiaceae bacterium]